MDQANEAFQQPQILFWVSHANVSTETPTNCSLVTYVLQLLLTLPSPYSCTAVSMTLVSHRTNRTKEPSKMAPGISRRRAARTRMTSRKRMVRPPVTIANGNNLVTGHFLPVLCRDETNHGMPTLI